MFDIANELNFVPYTIDSKVLNYMGYNFANNTLYIEFVNGKLYQYKDFPSNLFITMLSNIGKGISAGQLFNLIVKRYYKGEAV